MIISARPTISGSASPFALAPNSEGQTSSVERRVDITKPAPRGSTRTGPSCAQTSPIGSTPTFRSSRSEMGDSAQTAISGKTLHSRSEPRRVHLPYWPGCSGFALTKAQVGAMQSGLRACTTLSHPGRASKSSPLPPSCPRPAQSG